MPSTAEGRTERRTRVEQALCTNDGPAGEEASETIRRLAELVRGMPLEVRAKVARDLLAE